MKVQSKIDIHQPEPQPISDMKLIVPTSTPTIGNTNVVGSLFGQREIKFRAWDKWLKKFYYNSHILHVSGNKIFYDCGVSGWQISNAHSEFMQFTGLKDKNGKEIYEGDVIKMTNKRSTWYGIKEFTGIVEFDNSLQYIVRHKSDWIDLANPDYDIEVVGNIFENPELLQTLR